MKLTLLLALAVLALAPSAIAADGTTATRDCGEVAFTPDSDDMASDVAARCVSCRYARGSVRAAKGRPGKSFRGYACTKKPLDTALPPWRYRCVQDGELIRWVKT